MNIKIQVPVEASRHDVWRLITDIEHAADRIAGIEDVEVLEQPSEGVVGLKWRETRKFGGKTATETMWITEAEEDSYYLTEARSHGSVYRGRVYVVEENGATQLGMDFDAEPQTFGAKVLSAVVTPLFKGAMKKALLNDLKDIKAAAEASDETSEPTEH